MKTKLLGITLFTLTIVSVAFYPQLMAKTTDARTEHAVVHTANILPIVDIHTPVTQAAANSARIDVVFVLDTTGSMSGMIQTAKEKIWSIATSMASAQQAPEIRIGLVAYRDRGDDYVTKTVDLSSDLDSVYAALMDFEADGGGDGPESVNKALYDAVNSMSWTELDGYKAIFLVGDAPPHMDYNEERYPQILATAANKNIVVNTIQCGTQSGTAKFWQQIAALNQGAFFQVEQAGGAVVFATPYDKEIANLSAQLDDTRLYYGSKKERAKMESKVSATEKIHARLSASSRASRAKFNASASGRRNQLGENELIAAINEGEVELDDLDKASLPESLQALAPAEQKEVVVGLSRKRSELQKKIKMLSEDRSVFLAKKVEDAGGMKDSLDQKLFDAVKSQAADSGLEYKDGPAY